MAAMSSLVARRAASVSRTRSTRRCSTAVEVVADVRRAEGLHQAVDAGVDRLAVPLHQPVRVRQHDRSLGQRDVDELVGGEIEPQHRVLVPVEPLHGPVGLEQQRPGVAGAAVAQPPAGRVDVEQE